ncbi:recombinase family protein [Rhodobacterales bacterium HKCCSP123]|nr:recombinase family protein [Rhodobacterales bacterium HKCCSP123]
MNEYFAYLRVSTVKQGDGVSLEAQRDAIEAYAAKHDLYVSQWFEEKVTAAKTGRPLFTQMIRGLQRKEAVGVIVHKIDRSTRNLAEWALIGELIDQGADVRFAHEALDLRSRGGRLTADIQAVIAADYVRNLREECLKGIEGRLKQGLFPFAAPIGYLDQGARKPKAPDPERAPFVRLAFELYASQQYSIRGLLAELNHRGLRNKQGKPITTGCLETLLKNPFYCGRIFLRRSGRSYPGIHEPLISEGLFQTVQGMKSNRQQKRQTRHNHTYRRILKCAACNRSLVGEWQKDRVYMRCQTKGCVTKTIREDRIEAFVKDALLGLSLNDRQFERIRCMALRRLETTDGTDMLKALELRLSNLSMREDRLTDALIDQLIDKETYRSRKDAIDIERNEIRGAMRDARSVDDRRASVLRFLELAKSLALHYEMANPAQRRQIIQNAFSNCIVRSQNLSLTPQKWLREPAWTVSVLCGGPVRDRIRTLQEIQPLLEIVDTPLFHRGGNPQ